MPMHGQSVCERDIITISTHFRADQMCRGSILDTERAPAAQVTAANGVVLCGLSLASYSAGGYATVSGTTLSGTPTPPTIFNFYVPPYPNAALLTLNQAKWTRISSVTIQTAGLGGPDLFYISYMKL